MDKRKDKKDKDKNRRFWCNKNVGKKFDKISGWNNSLYVS
jgi:hypothetical protein